MRLIVRLLLVISSVIPAFSACPANAEKRVALVIGNATYDRHARLPNVRNDADAMAALFRAAGFETVHVGHNLGVVELRKALREFATRTADADVAALFYAGHGIEVGQANYLIPVDARLVTDFDIEDETVPLDRVLQAMERAKRLRLVILDACRENPFLKSMQRTIATRSIGRGLSRVELPTTNTLIAFATKPNAIAEDGKGPNSPFTAALVKHLLTPGLDLRIALGKVRDEVMTSTGKRQEPYVAGSLGGEVVTIVPGPPSAAPLASRLNEAAEAWAAVKDSKSIVQLEVIAGRYKGTVFADLAQARIAELRKLALASTSASKVSPNGVDDWFIPVFDASAEGALKPLDRFRDCVANDWCGPDMVVVPAGSFMMGSPASEEGRVDSEGPQRRVAIARPFAIGKFEVTFAEWDACVEGGGCKGNPKPSDSGGGKGRRPVINVSWYDAREYAAWLSHKTGKSYRLPTEAEWEYAARAGTTTRYSFGDMISKSDARFSQGIDGKTAEVGSYRPNRYGLHDMHGNASEWCEDEHLGFRALRGGAWYNEPEHLRSAKRYWALPSGRYITSVVTLTLVSPGRLFRGSRLRTWSRERAWGRHCAFPGSR